MNVLYMYDYISPVKHIPPAKHGRKDTTEMCNTNPTNTGNFKGTIIYKTCDI